MTNATQSPRFTAAQAQELHERARAAGKAAVEACTPTPMVVVQRANPWDDTSPVVKEYEPVTGGVCGFGYATITPANCSFARRLKRLTFPAYYGGAQMSASHCGQDRFDQSYERAMAAVTAYCAVLREAGVTAYPEGRVD